MTYIKYSQKAKNVDFFVIYPNSDQFIESLNYTDFPVKTLACKYYCLSLY